MTNCKMYNSLVDNFYVVFFFWAAVSAFSLAVLLYCTPYCTFLIVSLSK